MKVYGDFVIVENILDWENNAKKERFCTEIYYRLLGGVTHGTPNTITTADFPMVFIRSQSLDAHFCDDLFYSPTNEIKQELTIAIEKNIAAHEEKIKQDKELLLSL